ncbi:MAG: FHA domain-containing protein [Planctomycetes bacterium]|jgi:hypothetical protein|nr:FHA domain-containing protein [Planctomycetota bacterium]
MDKMRIGKILFSLDGKSFEYFITEPEVVVGRNITSEVSIGIPSPNVSRVQARFLCKEGKFFLENLSANQKSFVNGKVVQGVMELPDRAQLRFGPITVQFLVDEVKSNAEFLWAENNANQAKQMEGSESHLHTPTQAFYVQPQRENKLHFPKNDAEHLLVFSPPSDNMKTKKIETDDIPSSKGLEDAQSSIEFDDDAQSSIEFDDVQFSKELEDMPSSKGLEAIASVDVMVAEKLGFSDVEIEELNQSNLMNDFDELQDDSVQSHFSEAVVAEIASNVVESAQTSEQIEVKTAIASDSMEEVISLGEIENSVVHGKEVSKASADKEVKKDTEECDEEDGLVDSTENKEEDDVPDADFASCELEADSVATAEFVASASKIDIAELDFNERQVGQGKLFCVLYKKHWNLTKEITQVGRGGYNDVSILDESWEDVEFAIIFRQGVYSIKKIGNIEVRINGIPMKNIDALLKNGDMIQCGTHSFYFFDGISEEEKVLQYNLLSLEKEQKKEWTSPWLEPSKAYCKWNNRVVCNFQTFKNEERNVSYFLVENAYGVYILLCEMDIEDQDHFFPWLHGIFCAVTNYLESCQDILLEMNSLILQVWGKMKIATTMLKVKDQEIEYVNAGNGALCIQRDNAQQEVFFGRSLPLGICEHPFLESITLPWEESDSAFVATRGLLHCHEKIDPKVYIKQGKVEKLFSQYVLKNENVFSDFVESVQQVLIVDKPFGFVVLQNRKEQPTEYICPKCGVHYPLSFSFCPKDGSKLG